MKIVLIAVMLFVTTHLFAQDSIAPKVYHAYFMTYPVSIAFYLAFDGGSFMIPLSADIRFGDFPLCLSFKNDIFFDNPNSYSPGFKDTVQLGGRWQFSGSGLNGWFVRGRGVLYLYNGLETFSDHFPYFSNSPQLSVGYGFEMDGGYSWVVDNGLTLEVSAGWQSSFLVFYNWLSPTAFVLNLGIGWAI